MTKIGRLLAVASLSGSLVAPAMAVDSLVRIDCMAGTDGAVVYLNNTLRFTCEDFLKTPIPAPAGEHTIRAVKVLDAQYEQVFETTIELQANVPQRVRVRLPEKQLTAAGRAEQAEREAAALIAEEEARKQAAAKAEAARAQAAVDALAQDRAAAEAGDVDAMEAMVQRYENGDGVPKDLQAAEHWEARLQQQLKINALKATRYEMFPMTMGTAQMMFGSEEPNLFTATTAGFIIMPSTLLDMLSSPVSSTQNAMIDAEIEALQRETHAARWANPDALVARAFAAE